MFIKCCKLFCGYQVYFVYYYVAGRLDLFDDGIEKVEPIFKAQSVYKADIAFKLVKVA